MMPLVVFSLSASSFLNSPKSEDLEDLAARFCARSRRASSRSALLPPLASVAAGA